MAAIDAKERESGAEERMLESAFLDSRFLPDWQQRRLWFFHHGADRRDPRVHFDL